MQSVSESLLSPVGLATMLKNPDFLKNPHVVCFNSKGEIIGENNAECCEKYPCVSYFIPLVSDIYDEEKGSGEFQSKCSLLNEQLRYIADRLTTTRFCSSKIVASKINDTPVIDSLKDYFFAEKDYEGLDFLDSQVKFANKYFGLGLNKTMYTGEMER